MKSKKQTHFNFERNDSAFCCFVVHYKKKISQSYLKLSKGGFQNERIRKNCKAARPDGRKRH